MKPNIGIKEADRKAIAQGLSKHLADTYTLYLKTHNYHWNVTGRSSADITEETGVLKAKDMIRNLVEAHETVVRIARSVFPVAEKANDEATADLLTQRIQVHEKTAWMLRSLLEK